MKITRNTVFLILSIVFLLPVTACEKDDDNPDNNNNNNNPPTSGTGSADLGITGEVNAELAEYATWEITDDPLLRIRLGNEFPTNIVLNYRLGSTDVTDLLPGVYTAVSATYTGQPADEIAFQYNGDDTGFPESGTVTITSVGDNVIEGETDVTFSFLGGGTSTVTGTFSADPK